MEDSQVEPSDIFAGFPEQVNEDVEGLIWLGYLEDDFDFCGHNFVIRTLRGEEELLAGLVCKEYMEAIGQDKAWTWALISLAIVSVDGDEDFCPPVGRSHKDWARSRFQYCTQKWFWPLALAVFSHYSALIERQTEALQAVEDLFDGSLPTSTPGVDSSIDKGFSTKEETPMEDIRDYLVEEEED